MRRVTAQSSWSNNVSHNAINKAGPQFAQLTAHSEISMSTGTSCKTENLAHKTATNVRPGHVTVLSKSARRQNVTTD